MTQTTLQVSTTDATAVAASPRQWRALSDLAWLGVKVLLSRDGGLPLAPGVSALLASVDAASRTADACATPLARVEARQLTTAQAATVMGVSPQRVRQLAARGRIIARKTGRDWLIDAQAAEGHRRNR